MNVSILDRKDFGVYCGDPYAVLTQNDNKRKILIHVGDGMNRGIIAYNCPQDITTIDEIEEKISEYYGRPASLTDLTYGEVPGFGVILWKDIILRRYLDKAS